MSLDIKCLWKKAYVILEPIPVHFPVKVIGDIELENAV